MGHVIPLCNLEVVDSDPDPPRQYAFVLERVGGRHAQEGSQQGGKKHNSAIVF
jgi:hypothetical protein